MWFSPIAAFAASTLLLVVALTGSAHGQAPDRTTIVLVIDVSLSMNATDVAPSRLVAAQVTTKNFVTGLPTSVDLGLVPFAGSAAVLVSPTSDRNAVIGAIDTLKLSESTATGEAIFTALQTIGPASGSLPRDQQDRPNTRIVLMSDGKQTIPGPQGENEPRGSFTAARQAMASGIPISTIALGTRDGTIDLSGRPTPVPVDEPSTREIARLSGGESFSAQNQDQLRDAYRGIRERITS